MKKIGFYGYPPDNIIKEYTSKGYSFIDLDIDWGHPDSGVLPNIICQIIKNIVNNALYYKNDMELIIATTGEDKCDSGRFIVEILNDLGFNVLSTINLNQKMEPVKICNSNLPLKQKIDLIMSSITDPISIPPMRTIKKPKFGFWGVPPNDFTILDLFPDETAVYGWIRCVEAKVPANLELEQYIAPQVKTVFFTQSFCSKSILARYLAEKHNGLFIDMEKKATHSILSKIEAFIRLN